MYPADEMEPQQDATPVKDPQTVATEELDDRGWPVWAAPFLDTFRRGTPDVSRAAKAVEIARSTVYRLRDRDEAFALALHDAREEALDLLENTLYALGTSGLKATKKVTKYNTAGEVTEVVETEEVVRNAISGMFILKRYRPEFRESFRVEQSGPGGKPIAHEVTVVEETAERARADLERLHSTPA